ncbi:MAG: two-component regulator propeller domain-containing protein [Prevotella sp.]
MRETETKQTTILIHGRQRLHMLTAILTLRLVLTATTILSAIGNVCHAGNDRFGFIHFSNTYFSTSPQILSFQCDSIGIMWIGTSEGLYSYDGYRHTRQFEPRHFSNVRIHAICMMADTMYLGTDNGLLTYSMRSGEYRMASKDMKVVRCLLATGTDIIAGTANGLYRYDTTSGKGARTGNIDKGVYSLEKNGDAILVGTISGLYSVSNGKTQEIVLRVGKRPLVNSMLADKGRRCLWIGTEGKLYRMDDNGMKHIASLEGNSVKSIAINDEGNLFVGTDNGLYSIMTDGTTTVSRHSSTNPRSIANNIVWALYVDKWQNLWAGTDNGMSMTSGNSYYSFNTTDEITGRNDGNCIQAILKDSRGTLWAGGSNGLISYNDGKSVWYNQSNPEHYLSHNRIRKIYEDKSGDIWVASDHGINHLNNMTKRFDNYILYDKTGKYSTTWAYDILCDARNRLWIASYMGGVFVIDKDKLLKSDGKCTADHHIDDSKDKLPHIHIGQLAFDRDGNVWAMMYDNGVARINPDNLETTVIKNTMQTKCMTTDDDGNVWVALADKVVKFNAKGKRLHEYHIDNADGTEIIRHICSVGNDIWVFIGNHGKIITQSGKCHELIIPQLATMSSFCSKTNENVYIGGNDCILKMYVNTVTAGKPKDKVFLSELLVNGKLYRGAKALRATYSDNVTLNHDENNMTFELTDLPYDNLPSRRYAYRLEGSSEQWKLIGGSDMKLTYNGLPYGKYRLVVKSLDDNGTPSDDLYELKINILPPWYLTLWAKAAYALLMLCLLLWATNFYIVRRNLKQTRKEKENIIQQSLSRARFYNDISERLLCQLRQMIPSIQGIMVTSDSTAHKELSILKRSAGNINMLVHQDLSVDGMSHTTPTARNEVDIIEFCTLWARHSEGVVMTTKASTSSLMLDIDIVRLDFIFSSIMEYIYNKVEHPATIHIAVEQEEGCQTATITIGCDKLFIAEPDRQFIFQRYRQPTDSTTGMMEMQPLYIANDYVEECNGHMAVEALPDNGMNITIVMPCFSANIKKETIRNEATKDSDEKLLLEVTRAIEGHLADSDFNVSRLQEELGVGGKLLARKIKKATDKTPVEFIRHIRLQKAAYMLKEGKFNVSEVMYMVGFSKPGYFSKCFHDTFGMTPSEYIKRQH